MSAITKPNSAMQGQGLKNLVIKQKVPCSGKKPTDVTVLLLQEKLAKMERIRDKLQLQNQEQQKIIKKQEQEKFDLKSRMERLEAPPAATGESVLTLKQLDKKLSQEVTIMRVEAGMCKIGQCFTNCLASIFTPKSFKKQMDVWKSLALRRLFTDGSDNKTISFGKGASIKDYNHIVLKKV